MDTDAQKRAIKSPLLQPTSTLQFNKDRKITVHSLHNSELMNNTSLGGYRNTVRGNIRVTSYDYGENGYESTHQEGRNPLLLKGIGALNIRNAFQTSIKNMFKKDEMGQQERKSGSQNVEGDGELENMGTGRFAFNTIAEAEDQTLQIPKENEPAAESMKEIRSTMLHES